MCGRFTLRTANRELLQLYYADPAVDLPDLVPPRFNIPPMTPIVVVRAKKDEPGRELTTLKWGLVPFWADDPKIGSRMINARAEDIENKPAFREPLRRRRCVIPADGFYEWQRIAGKKTKRPYLFELKSGEPFAFAGLWDRCTKSGEPLETATIVTTTPNEPAAKVHDRMPAILTGDAVDRWLDPKIVDPRLLVPLLAPYDASQMTARPVSALVNSPANDGPECLEPA